MEQIQTLKSKAYYYTGTLLVAMALVLLVSLLTFETFFGRAPEAYLYSLLGFTCLAFITTFIVTYRNLKQGKQAELERRILSILRFVLSTVMLGYSFTKLRNGHMYLSYFSLDNRLNDLNDFDHVWSFYGRFSAFQTLIGFLELLPSVLLLFRRTAFLGTVIMLPVISNVVILNVFYKIGGATLPLSAFLLVFDLYLLYSYKALILEFLGAVRRHADAAAANTSPVKKTLATLRFLPLIFISLLILVKWIQPKNERAIHGGYALLEFRQNARLIPADSLPQDAYKKIYFEKRHIQNSVMNAEGSQGATILFPAKDSITIAYRDGMLDVYVEPDTATMFKGHYHLEKDLLVIRGTQNKQTVEAKYKKIPLKEYAYWWE